MLVSSSPPERAIYQQAERFVQSALDALSAHVAVLDEQGTIIGVNHAWRAFADANGYEPMQGYGVGTNYLDVCDKAASAAADALLMAEGIRDIMNGTLSVFEMEYPCHSPTEQRWFVVRVSRFQWQGQQRFIVAHQNVTELKALQIELAQWQRRVNTILEEARAQQDALQAALAHERDLRELKNRFLSMLSHELKTPLTSISLSSDMLKKYRHVSSEEEQAQALDNIQAQVAYLAEMVSDVMTLSKGEHEGIALHFETVDLVTYCRDIVEEFQFTYNKTHRVQFTSNVRQLRASIDRKLLRRAITNLLANAVKYTPEGGTVTLRTKKQRGWAVVQVADTGIGIPADEQARLFEPFHRARNAQDIGGTGLGLPITKQAVELHGGHIMCKSAQGEGTTFTLRLPLRD